MSVGISFSILYALILHSAAQTIMNQKETDWCKLKCSAVPNIACEFKGECSAPAEPCKFLELDRIKIVGLHNHLRLKFARGAEPKAPDIQVANMKALKWDDDLALLARCNLMKCNSDIIYDQCHITNKFTSAGQNIGKSLGVEDCIEAAYDHIETWYKEIQSLPQKEIKRMGKNFVFNIEADHFTQLIWASTSHVGCALSLKGSKSSSECMLTCNYAPAGNLVGRRMFEEGKPGSACPHGNKVNDGLCKASSYQGLAAQQETIIFVTLLMILRYVLK